MSYKWCVVPQCTNTSISSPTKLFISVPTTLKRRKLWLQLARRDPKSISMHSNVFMCEDHFDMEKDTKNYMKYKMGFSQKILLTDEAVPTKFHCQEDRKRRLSDPAPRKVFLKRQRTELVTECVQSQSATATHAESLQVDDMTQKGIEDEATPSKKQVVKESVVSPKNVSQEQENNSTEKTELLRDRSVRLRNRKAYLANRRCSIPQCNSRSSNEVSLHPCPNNAAVRNEWAEALKVSYQYIKNMVVCSKHFTKLNFVHSKNVEHRVLKQNAVPSRNLPNRKRVVLPVKHKPTKKLVPSKAFERQKTMTENVDEEKKVVQDEEIRECRACLRKLEDKNSSCNVFQAWAPPWFGMEATIAEDLAKLANVEISITDRHSKLICSPCYQRLLDAATFASSIRTCDLLLRQRFATEIDMEKVWPKPIQVDKNIDGSVYNSTLDIEIKQEVLTDEEYNINQTDNAYVDNELANLDIKIEPEEFVEPPPMNIAINGTISLDPLNSENKNLNGTAEHQEAQFLELPVKQEPMSEEEHETVQTPDLPLECMLCTKSFNSVTGLKAHVIAHHSYKSVKRKSDGSVSPQKKRTDKHQCAICRRSFQTPTDLMVHETCHNKHACYGCTQKFDSFELLSRHRKRCKASINNAVQKLKTLDDVKRPLPEEKVESLKLEIKKDEAEEIKKEADSDIKEVDSEMKTLESELKAVESEMIAVQSEIKEAECEAKEIESDKKEVKNDTKELESETKETESETKEAESETKEAESETKEVEIENKEAILEDSNMKLHLEIHSTKSETETMLADTDMQIETLQNDDT